MPPRKGLQVIPVHIRSMISCDILWTRKGVAIAAAVAGKNNFRFYHLLSLINISIAPT
jgi:hypothetical protein